MPYPSVNLEPPPKPAPSPIVAFHAVRKAFTHEPVACVVCGARPCETFADAIHADGNVTGWVPVCEACAKPAPESPPAPEKPPVVETTPAPGPAQ